MPHHASLSVRVRAFSYWVSSGARSYLRRIPHGYRHPCRARRRIRAARRIESPYAVPRVAERLYMDRRSSSRHVLDSAVAKRPAPTANLDLPARLEIRQCRRRSVLLDRRSTLFCEELDVPHREPWKVTWLAQDLPHDARRGRSSSYLRGHDASASGLRKWAMRPSSTRALVASSTFSAAAPKPRTFPASRSFGSLDGARWMGTVIMRLKS